mgnify:CR=1 FL=1
MKYSINAVVVTCNRCELLKQTIDALLNQTYPLNKIVISTDGTKEYLDSVIDNRLRKQTKVVLVDFIMEQRRHTEKAVILSG